MTHQGPPQAPEPPQGSRPPWTPPPVGSYGRSVQGPPASPDAITALVLGLGAWLCFPLGFVAIWIGARARRAIRDNPGTLGGDQLALAGMIVGGILSGLQLMFWLAYVLLIAFAVLRKP